MLQQQLSKFSNKIANKFVLKTTRTKNLILKITESLESA